MPDLARRRPNAWDVAARAGVSVATVSRVVNGQPFVRSETRERVEDAINTLGYVPNSHARMLAQSGQRADLEPITWLERGVEDWVGEQMLAGALRAAASAGRSVTVVPRGCDANEVEITSTVPERAEVASCGLTVVRAGGPASAARLSLRLGGRHRCWLAADHRMAGRLAGDRLSAGGFVDALLVTGGRADDVADARRAGLASALAKVGGNLELVDVRREAGDAAPAHVVIERVTQRTPRPTALVVESVANAVGVYRALGELRLRIPGDVSVIAFDDESTRFARHLDPPLTTVETRYDLVGELAISMLMDLIAGGSEVALADELLVAPRLVEGGSVGMTADRATRDSLPQ